MKSTTQAWVRRMAVAGMVALGAPAAQAQSGGYSVVGGTPGSPQTIGVVPSTAGERVRSRTVATQRLDDGRVHRPEEYGGITPGMPNLAPGFRRLAAMRSVNAPVVAWPGFQVTPTGSRVFVAMTRSAAVTESRSALQRVYHIPGGRIGVSNNRRPLITEAFPTPLRRALLRASRGGVDLVLQLRSDVEGRLSQEPGPQGLQFVYVDFPPYAPPAEAEVALPNGRTATVLLNAPGVMGPAPRSVTPGGPGVAVTEVPLGTDTERPPAMQPSIGRAVRHSNGTE